MKDTPLHGSLESPFLSLIIINKAGVILINGGALNKINCKSDLDTDSVRFNIRLQSVHQLIEDTKSHVSKAEY
jgi:hypothetical protein